MSDILRLAQILEAEGLPERVRTAAIVAARLAIEELPGTRELTFRGTVSSCARKDAHEPHVVGGYPTVACGWGQYYCLGSEGERLRIYILDRQTGSPSWFSSARVRVEWLPDEYSTLPSRDLYPEDHLCAGTPIPEAGK